MTDNGFVEIRGLLRAGHAAHPHVRPMVATLRRRAIEAAAIFPLLLQAQDSELVVAVRAGDLPRVEAVLRSGASPDVRIDDWAETPLMLAAELNYPEIAQVLLDAGADLEAKDRINATAVMYATAARSNEVLTLLLKAGANCSNVQGGLGRTPLLAALAYGNEEAVKLMVEAGANLNIQGGEIAKMSPLMLAASRGLRKATIWLLDGGARVNDLSRDTRKTALDYAIERGHTEIVDVLRAHGAKLSIDLEQ